MALVRYKMWVSEVNEEEDYIYAEGYKEGDDSGHRFQLTMEYANLRENISESDFNELIDMHQANSNSVKVLPDFRTGRLFILEGDEDTGDEKIIVPEYKPFTKEQIELGLKRAEELMKAFDWDDDKSDSSND